MNSPNFYRHCGILTTILCSQLTELAENLRKNPKCSELEDCITHAAAVQPVSHSWCPSATHDVRQPLIMFRAERMYNTCCSCAVRYATHEIQGEEKYILCIRHGISHNSPFNINVVAKIYIVSCRIHEYFG